MKFIERERRKKLEIYEIGHGERMIIQYQDPSLEDSAITFAAAEWPVGGDLRVTKYMATPEYGAPGAIETLNKINIGTQKWKAEGGVLGSPGVKFERIGQQEVDSATGEIKITTKNGHGKGTLEIIFKVEN